MARTDRLLRGLLRERFVVTLRNGAAFDGLLMDADDKTIRLADASGIDGRNRVKVDGEMFLPRTEVVYMQKPQVSA